MKQVTLCAAICVAFALLLACGGVWAFDNCSRYGVVDQWGYETPELGQGTMDLIMAELGCKYIRSAWNWDQIEGPGDNQYDQNYLNLMDNWVVGMNYLGVKVFYNFGYTPAWARPGGTTNATPPTDPSRYTDFITFMVNRYKNQGLKDWGFWNEPNLSMFYNGNYNWYIQNLLIPGIQAVKAADPTAKCIVGELSSAGDDVNKLQTMLQAIDNAGLHNQVDVVCHHQYDGGDTYQGRLADIDILRNMLVNIGWGSKDFWITETGLMTSGGQTEATQNTMLSGFMQGMDARRSWWKKTFWFTLTEGAPGQWGLLRPDQSHKPAFDTYKSYIAAHAGDQWTYGNGGSAWSIPRRLEAENYDDGCEGVSYHDADSVNSGAAYRTEGVDIEGCSEGGYNVGWINTGEWLEYTVSSSGGTFDFTQRVASAGGGGSYHIEVDGNNVTGTKSFSGTGGWQNWTNSAATNISIPSGNHILRLYVEGGGWNINYMEITQSSGGQTPYAGVIQLPGTIQAENYDNGGEGVAYHDLSSGNYGGAYRSENVDIETTGDTGGGYNIGWIDTGEWLEYTVNVASSGVYDITARVATPGSGAQLHFEMNGSQVGPTLTVPNTGNWQVYTNVTATNVSLNAGQQIMRIYFNNGGFNLNYVTVSSQASTINGKAAGTITINGSSSDWSLGDFTTLSRGGQNQIGDIALVGYDGGTCYYGGYVGVLPTSASDHTAKVYCRENSTYLYFLVRCDDNDIQYPYGVDMNWANDCAEFFIDPSHDHGSSAISNSASDVQLDIDANNQKNVYMCTSGYTTQVLNGVTSAVVRDGTGWWLEFRITKTAIDPDLPGSGPIGIDFNFRDNDNNNDAALTTVYDWRGPTAGSFPTKIPNDWGHCILP